MSADHFLALAIKDGLVQKLHQIQSSPSGPSSRNMPTLWDHNSMTTGLLNVSNPPYDPPLFDLYSGIFGLLLGALFVKSNDG